MTNLQSALDDEGPEFQSGAEVGERLQVLGRIAEEYHAQVSTGERFDIAPHLAAYPEFGKDIRELVNTLDVLGSCEPQQELGESKSPVVGREFAGFRILREIGRGGMGVVYEAEQVALQRRVALKILPFTHSLSSQQLRRFANEAMIAAQLRHPNIVSVFWVGHEQDLHFYVMEYIDGVSMADIIQWEAKTSVIRRDDLLAHSNETRHHSAEILPQSDFLHEITWLPEHASERCRWAAEVAATLALALEHAHQAGVIHRDVKPSNLLFDRQGKVYLADFGLAQFVHDSAVTRTGDIVGTLRYMSPEQAAGNRRSVDARADVYSLGITLYEMVAGQPAFRESAPANLLAQVIHKEPLPVRKIDSRVPVDLETIILKATAKVPQDRYDSAQEFADDLGRFLDNRPIQARRLGLVESMARWMWRRRTTVMIASLCAMLVTVLLAASAALAYLSKQRAETALDRLEVIAEDAAQAARREERERRRAELLLYVADMQAAARAAGEGDLGRLSKILDRYAEAQSDGDQRGFEWWWLRDRWSLPAETVSTGNPSLYSVQFSPDAARFAVAGADAKVRVFDASSRQLQLEFATGQGEVNQVTFDSLGTRLATSGDDGSVRIWSAENGREIERFSGHESQCFGVVLAPDGKKIYSCGSDGRVHCWPAGGEAASNTLIGEHRRAVEAIALSPDGRWLLSAGADFAAKLWDTHTRAQTMSILPEADSVHAAAFSTAGLAAVGTKHGVLVVFDPEAPEHLWCGTHFDDISSLAFANDGRTLISGDGGGVIRVWELPDAEQSIPAPSDHTRPAALLGNDQLRLLSFDRLTESLQSEQTTELLHSGRLRIIRTRPLRLLANTKGHTGRVYSVAAAAGSPAFLSAGEDGRLVQWRLRDTDHVATIDARPEHIMAVAPLPNRLLALASRERGVELWNLDGDEPAKPLLGVMQEASCVAASPTGRLLAVGGPQAALEIWDLRTGKIIRRIDASVVGDVSRLVFSPDEQLMAVLYWNRDRKIAGAEGILHVYGVVSEEPLAELRARDSQAATFQPGSDKPTLVYRDGQDLVLWEPKGERRRIVAAHQNAINCIAYSADGSCFATTSDDRSVKLWNASGDHLATLVGHRDHVLSACFHPNGRTLVTGSEDGEVRLWNVATGQPLFSLRQFDRPVMQLAFTSGERHLACLLTDGTLHLIATGSPY